jgi:hypothetical protein
MSEDEPGQGSPSAGADPSDDEVEKLRAERDALRAERDALEARIDEPRRSGRRRLRRFLVGCLVGLASLGVVLSTVVVWTHRTVLNTDTFVATVSPIFSDPVVTNEIAARTTTQLFDQLDVEARLKQALPPKASFIAGPATSSAEHFVQAQLSKALAKPEVQHLWERAIARAHPQLVALLRGQKSPVLSSTGNTVVLNAIPIINRALGQISGLISDVAGKPVTLPTITSAELPQSAVNKLSKAFGVQFPANFGQIPLFEAKQLTTVQRGVRAFDRLTIALPLITIALIALGLWLSLSRRRTLIQLLVVSLLLIILVRRLTTHLQSTIVSKAHNPEVVDHLMGYLLHGLFVMTAWILGVGLALLVIALVTGPYRWAVRLRSYVVQAAHWIAENLSLAHRPKIVTWIADHANSLRLGGAVLAGILLLVVSVSWASFLTIGILLILYELAVGRISASSDGVGVSAPPGSAAP